MAKVCVFPGQGSQFVGMGEELFAKYPDLVAQADQVLGYSIVELCTQDPNNVLNETQYTQPALYFVSALSYLDWQQENKQAPLYLAGHSLGEYCALFAAGAFSLIDGLKIVQKRGQLMANAPKGAMAAVVNLPLQQVTNLIAESQFPDIDVANINSKQQLIISGLYDDIHACAEIFTEQDARFIPLKVSAAFHSHYMAEVADEFAQFLTGFTFNPLNIPVISNYSARLYPNTNYLQLLTKQIDHSVKWYESMSWLLTELDDNTDIEEVGPGFVLTKMLQGIKRDPMSVAELEQAQAKRAAQELTQLKAVPIAERKNIFMFAGQGTQYFGMAKSLYQSNDTFKQALDNADQAFIAIKGYSLVDEIYQSPASLDFNYLGASHPAIFCIGYALYQTLTSAGVKADGFIGHSLGEYIAAVAAGVMDFDTGLKLVIKQAELVMQHCPGGALLSVMASKEQLSAYGYLVEKVHLAGVNYDNNLLFSGDKKAIYALYQKLSSDNINGLILPVQHGFHSPLLAAMKVDYQAVLDGIDFNKAKLPLYSCTSAGLISDQQLAYPQYHLWQVIRQPVNFKGLMMTINLHQYNFIDLSATGTLSTFVKHGLGKDISTISTLNQFGNNNETLDFALQQLAKV